MGKATSGSGMIQRAQNNALTLMNFHNQGVMRAEFQGSNRRGFTVEFLGFKSQRKLEQALEGGVLRIVESSITAVIATTDTVKQKLRSYLDSHFLGSQMHGNAHRRISNALVQSAYYDEVDGKPGFASLIYSKLGKGKGPSSFVDFLLLHVRGGTIGPKQGEWMPVVNDETNQGALAKVGDYGTSKVFFLPSKDGQKLYLLRKIKGGGSTTLLATLVKSIQVPASLTELDSIAAERGALFERNFDAAWKRSESKVGAA